MLVMIMHYYVANDYALGWSAKNGHNKVVKLLLENGSDVHQFTALISLRSARKLSIRWVC